MRPWIQAFPWRAGKFDEEYILEELRALRQSKARGWLLWSAGNFYNTAWKALAQWNNSAEKESTASASPEPLQFIDLRKDRSIEPPT